MELLTGEKINSDVLSAMISGCIRIYVLEDSRLTLSRLKEVVLAMEDAPSESEIESLIGREGPITSLLLKAATSGWTIAQLDSSLKELGLNQEYIDIFSSAWRKEETKILKNLRDRSYWGQKLQRLSWRVDISTKSRSLEEINEPCAVMEMAISSPKNPSDTNVLRFEVDKETMSQMSAEVSRLQQMLEAAAS